MCAASRLGWAKMFKPLKVLRRNASNNAAFGAAFLPTALTVLTRLTALTADRIDHIDIVDGPCAMRSTSSTMSAVNTVNAVNKVNTVQTHSRPPQAADCSYLLQD